MVERNDDWNRELMRKVSSTFPPSANNKIHWKFSHRKDLWTQTKKHLLLYLHYLEVHGMKQRKKEIHEWREKFTQPWARPSPLCNAELLNLETCACWQWKSSRSTHDPWPWLTWNGRVSNQEVSVNWNRVAYSSVWVSFGCRTHWNTSIEFVALTCLNEKELCTRGEIKKNVNYVNDLECNLVHW